MFVTDTTENVKKLFEELEEMTDKEKMGVLLYVFEKINNNQVNNKNIANPDLVEDDDLVIFKFENIGLSPNLNNLFLEINIQLYNIKFNDNLFLIDGNIRGIKYSIEEKELISKFEKLKFDEKLDVISELVIKYNKDTYFKKNTNKFSFCFDDEFDIASRIKEYKNEN